MQENRHSQAIPENVLAQVKTKLGEVNDLLKPYAVPLTPDDRRDLAKMGEKTRSFVQKAYDLAVANPDLCPPLLNVNEFKIDVTDAMNLTPFIVAAQQVEQTLDDIGLLAGSEAFQTALAFYHYIHFLEAQNVPKAKAVYEELRQRFPGRGKKTAAATPQA